MNPLFPYTINESGEGWIFSALDCQCSLDDFNMALQQGLINENYKTLLIANLHDDKPKPESFQPID